MNKVLDSGDSSIDGNEARFHRMLEDIVELLGRILIAGLFLFSGIGKMTGYAATILYMTSAGIPGAILPLVIATEVLGALAVILGWHTRLVGFLLAVYTLLTAVFFHTNFADQTQTLMFLKNVSITGAFLLLTAHGAGGLSLDKRRA